MSDKKSEILSLAEQFKSNNQAGDKIMDLLEGEKPTYLAQLLWESFRENKVDLGEHNKLWYRLREDKTAYSAKDLLRLLQSINQHFPRAMSRDREGQLHDIHFGPEPKGYFYGLLQLIEVKKDEPDFVQEIKEEWCHLPAPYRLSVGYVLTKLGLLDHTEIPEDVKEKVAYKFLQHGASSRGYWHQLPNYPPQMWGELLLKTSLKHEPLTYEKADILKDFLPLSTSKEQALQLLSKSSLSFDRDLEGIVSIIEVFGEETLASLEKIFQTTEIGPRPNSPSERWPHFVYTVLYLSLCKKLSYTPPTTVDDYFQGFLEHYRSSWTGTRFPILVGAIQDLLQQIPPERLEKMLLNASKVKWLWLPACPTPKILQWITDQIALFPSSPDDETKRIINDLTDPKRNSDFRGGLLVPLREDLIPYFTKALQETNSPQRKIYVDVLAAAQSPKAIEGLLTALQDSAKSIRQTAQEALDQQQPEEIIPKLVPLLESKRKKERLTAASILDSFPPSQAAYELAQRYLPKEKAKDIEALLSGVKAP
ncbi:MAG: HEAT repeat domain-containing protein [Myxococcales bacterium]|nr:HEAT repeat domain-containing protein [Myxococcales bacterium]